jgi:hypothetical protein
MSEKTQTPKQTVLTRYPEAFILYVKPFSKRRKTKKGWQVFRPCVIPGGPAPLSPSMKTPQAAWALAALMLNYPYV